MRCLCKLDKIDILYVKWNQNFMHECKICGKKIEDDDEECCSKECYIALAF